MSDFELAIEGSDQAEVSLTQSTRTGERRELREKVGVPYITSRQRLGKGGRKKKKT